MNYALDNAAPVGVDVQPGSPFLATLNAAPEPFRRYSIEVKTRGRWQWIRMGGDARCDPGSWCDGPRLYSYTERAYDAMRKCSNHIVRAVLGSFTEKCRQVRWKVHEFDAMYQRLSQSAANTGDGLVPAAAQAYPGAQQRWVFNNAEISHTSETKSPEVATVLNRQVFPFMNTPQ